MKRTRLSFLVLVCLLISVSGCCQSTKAVKDADQWVQDVLW